MTTFPLHTLDSAPKGSLKGLEWSIGKYGFVPNILAAMASSPMALDAYIKSYHIFLESTLSAQEQHFLMLAVSVHMKCAYYATSHSWSAAEQAGVPQSIIDSLRKGAPIPDRRLAALKNFAIAVFENRDQPLEKEVRAFLDAGFTPEQVLDVVVGVAVKVLSNNIAHITQVPLDDLLKPLRWTDSASD